MKRLYLITIATMLALTSSGQTIINFGNFPPTYLDTSSFKTSDLLEKIRWKSLKEFCDTAKGHYVYEEKDSLLTTFSYIKQGREASFKIVSYKDFVLEFYADLPNSSKPTTTTYFDKKLWLQYAKDIMPVIQSQFQLSITEPKTILKSYYELVGVNTRDEYGWICEYASVGGATTRRKAVIELLRHRRIDLLKKLIEYPNLQTQLYAIEALIYHDYKTKSVILEHENKIKEEEIQIDSLSKLAKTDEEKIERLKYQVKDYNDYVEQLKKELLSQSDWQLIHKLRDSKKTVLTCGNGSSYKIYQTPIGELLSDIAIADIPKQYELLKSLGHHF